MNPLNPKKLLLSKWTAAHPTQKEKHFLVTKVIEPEIEGGKIEWIEIEAVYTNNARQIAWRELQDTESWKQGWV